MSTDTSPSACVQPPTHGERGHKPPTPNSHARLLSIDCHLVVGWSISATRHPLKLAGCEGRISPADVASCVERHVLFVHPRFTSRPYRGCGAVRKKALSDRRHSCPCGTKLDRDHNAAIPTARLRCSPLPKVLVKPRPCAVVHHKTFS